METARTTSATVTLDTLVDSWARDLNARVTEGHLSPKTVRAYTDQARAFAAFAADRGMPTEADKVTREHVEAYVHDLLGRAKPSTALTHYRSLQQFFAWLVEDGEIAANPMARTRPPRVAEPETPVIREGDLKALLDACKGRGFDARRDTAILRVFMNTGCRLAEVAGLGVDDVDLDHGEMRVKRKGRREQTLPLGAKTVQALDRYARARRGHPSSFLSDLWLGAHGTLTDSGIAQMVKRRCREAGIEAIHPHQFRHTWASTMKSKGASDETLQVLGGWRSPTMLSRYAAYTAAERAREVHMRLAPGEDF